VNQDLLGNSSTPLDAQEVIELINKKWGVTYEMRILIRSNRIYLQIMWGYLEQQSFPFKENDFRENLNETLEVINRLGQAFTVRNWLATVLDKPRVGRALSLRLRVDERMEEFVLGTDQ